MSHMPHSDQKSKSSPPTPTPTPTSSDSASAAPAQLSPSLSPSPSPSPPFPCPSSSSSLSSSSSASLPLPIITEAKASRPSATAAKVKVQVEEEDEEPEDDSESADAESCDAISKTGHEEETDDRCSTPHQTADKNIEAGLHLKSSSTPSSLAGLSHCNNKKSKVRHRRLGQIRWYHLKSCMNWSIWSSATLEGRGMRLMLLILLLMSPGLICHYLWPELTIDNDPILYWSAIVTFILTGFFVIKFLIQLFLFICHRSTAFDHHSSSWLYHLTECKGYVAFFLYVVVFAVLWNTTPLHDTTLWKGHVADANKVFFTIAITIITFAYKNHLVNSMAMSFNYANYMERIQDTLFADAMLHALLKSKHTYRVKRRLWLQLQAQQQAANLTIHSHGWRRSTQRDPAAGAQLSSGPTTLTGHPAVLQPSASSHYLTLNPTRLASFFTDPSRRWGANSTGGATPSHQLRASGPGPGPAGSVLKTAVISPDSSYSDMPHRQANIRSSDTLSLVASPSRPSGHVRSQSSRPLLTTSTSTGANTAVGPHHPSPVIFSPSLASPTSEPFLSSARAMPSHELASTPLPAQPEVAIDMQPFYQHAPGSRQDTHDPGTSSPISIASEPLSAHDAAAAAEQKPGGDPYSSPTHPSDPSVAPSHTAPMAPEQQFNPFNVQQELFAFHKLAQRLVAQFEATARSTSTESSTANKASNMTHDSEIRREARILSKKLYKWLLPVDVVQIRTSLIKADFSEIIDNPTELDRLWNMLTFRQQEQITQKQPSSSQPISTDSPKEPSKDHAFFHGSSSGSYGKESSPSALLRHPATAHNGSIASIQLTHLTDFIERSYREVISLSKSLGSMEAAVKKLNIFFSIICIIVLLVFMALFFGQFSTALNHMSSVLVGTAFVFGSTGKNLFESMIFLFVMHPFDVGDRIYVSLASSSGPLPPISLPGGGALLTNATPASGNLENLVVLEMNLITTVFERWDGAKIYIPNYVLASKPVINIRRSGALNEIHRLQFDFKTPVAKLNELKRRLLEFLKKEATDYTDQIIMNVELIENLNRMHILIMVQHRTNWQDFEAQLNRKSKILMFFKDTVEALGISYTPPVQRVEVLPSYDAAMHHVKASMNGAPSPLMS